MEPNALERCCQRYARSELAPALQVEAQGLQISAFAFREEETDFMLLRESPLVCSVSPIGG